MTAGGYSYAASVTQDAMPGSSAAALSRVTEIDQGRPDCRYIYRQGMLLSGDRCKVNFKVLRRYKEAPILEPLSLPKMPVCFPLNFPLTAFSEFYGILRASLESLENTTLFRRAFTPFYTPSLIQVPPRAPTPQVLRNLRSFSLSKIRFFPRLKIAIPDFYPHFDARFFAVKMEDFLCAEPQF